MTAIVNSCLPFPNFISSPPVKNISCTRNLSGAIPYLSKKRNLQLPAVASTSCPQIDVEYLQREFRTCEVTFTGIGNSCVVKMELENGTAANLVLPSGLITSFKAQMWHGGTMELLHTFVSECENTAAVFQGGLSLALGCENGDGVSWSPNAWALHRIKGTPQESIQVELISSNEGGNAEVKHIMTLQRDFLDSEILVSNTSASSLHLTGSAICPLVVSTPEATYAVGLEGSDYFIGLPLEANFSICPPDFKRTGQHPGNPGHSTNCSPNRKHETGILRVTWRTW